MRFHPPLVGALLILPSGFTEQLWRTLDRSELTPELSRTAARHGGVVHASTQAEPRSGLGLNELLGVAY